MVVMSRSATLRLGVFGIAFMALCAGGFVLLDSASWMVAATLAGLAYAVARVGWFLVSPPWQLRMAPSGEAVELRSLTRMVRRTVTAAITDVQSVGPLEPYGSNQWNGGAVAAGIGRVLGLWEVAIRTDDRLHRIIGSRTDLASPVVQRLRARVE